MKDPDQTLWYVLRDLKRPNAKLPAYKQLSELGFEVYTPLRVKVCELRGGRRSRREVPIIPDLLFAHASRTELDGVIGSTPTLQYRFVKGGEYCEAMTVRDSDMERFLRVSREGSSPIYYSMDEVTELMRGRQIRIMDGPLEGVEGTLLSIRGSKKRRIVVQVPGILGLSVEVCPELIEFI